MLVWHKAVCTRRDQGRPPGHRGAHTESGEMPIIMKRETSPAGSEMGDQKGCGSHDQRKPFPSCILSEPQPPPWSDKNLILFSELTG